MLSDRRRRPSLTLGSVRAATCIAIVLLASAAMATTSAATVSAGASTLRASQASGVSGEAYGHYTSVSLFGGAAIPIGPDPHVELPPGGSDRAITSTDGDGAIAQYGPARLFSGIWPEDVQNAPPSGPISVSTRGTPGGTVTSTADIGVYAKPLAVACDKDPPGKTSCSAPGGFGPMPVTQGEQLHSTCSATPQGITGAATFVKAQVAKTTDPDGEPTDVESVPDRPPANYTVTGQISNLGDSWKAVYNEQTRDPDGTLTVNAIHLFLLGPTAIGEQILGHVKCWMETAAGPASSTAEPSVTGAATSAASAPPATEAAASSKTRPIVLGVLGIVLVAALVFLLFVRRPAPRDPTPGPGPS